MALKSSIHPDPAPQLNLGAFPESPYAAELQRGFPRLRFDPKLEAEYVQAHLLHNRTLIRIACLLSVLLMAFRAIELTVADAWNLILGIDLTIVSGASALLAWLAWTPNFERRYLPWAQFIVPIRNVIIVSHIAEAASRGHLEMLMTLTTALIAPFFFLGFRFRLASLTGAATLVCFIAAAAVFKMPPPLALHASMFLLSTLLGCVVASWNVEKQSRTAFLENRLIVELAEHDALTGAKNRRIFDEHLSALWAQAVADRRTLAIILIDVDHFKAYNDLYGHQAGDQALRRIVHQLQLVIADRPHDLVARYGGEEFAVLLYDVDGKQAADLANRMRRGVEELNIEHHGARLFMRVTISAGVAAVEAKAARDPRGALQLADQALYEAKSRGRNRVELMNEAEYKSLVTGIFSKEAFSKEVFSKDAAGRFA